MTSTPNITQASKFLSYVLRHKPEAINLQLDAHGWANLNELISKCNSSSECKGLDHELIQEIVRTNDKKRFCLSEDGQFIRANQGHSIHVDLGLKPIKPPEILYHGTATRFLESILKEGLKPQARQHVHLSTEIETAVAVAQRYGKPVILRVEAGRMFEQGFTFFLSDNGVWLTESVPTAFINE